MKIEKKSPTQGAPYKVRLVPINQTKPAPSGIGQRAGISNSHVDYLAANMDLNALGFPCVNLRDGVYWVFDGQHRIEALRKLGFKDELLDCRVYEGLTDTEMARMFLRVNTSKSVDSYSKFANACSAGFEPELAVRRIVESNGLRIGRTKGENCISCVASCLAVYHEHGDAILGRVLRVLRDAFDGEATSFDSSAIVGLGLVFGRYNGRIVEKNMVAALIPSKQGIPGVLRTAAQTRLRIGAAKTLCVAATLVDIYNKAQSNSNKIPSWWQE